MQASESLRPESLQLSSAPWYPVFLRLRQFTSLSLTFLICDGREMVNTLEMLRGF